MVQSAHRKNIRVCVIDGVGGMIGMRSFLHGVCKLVAVALTAVLCIGGSARVGEAIARSADRARPLVIAHRGASGVAPDMIINNNYCIILYCPNDDANRERQCPRRRGRPHP